MLKNILTILFISVSGLLCAQNNNDSLFMVLDHEIERAPEYIEQRKQFIETLKKDDKIDIDYGLNRQIYGLYRSFQYDSAYVYANKALQIANRVGDANLILEARSNLLFSLLSSGFFKEGIDIIDTTNSLVGDSLVRADFYINASRLYSDLGQYHNSEFFSDTYNDISAMYLDSAIMFTPLDSYEHQAMLAAKSKEEPLEQQLAKYKELVAITPIDEHEYAINCANLANLALMSGDTILAIESWAKSAIIDTRLSVMETTAKRDLAKVLYAQGDINKAIKYIHSSLDEANFYNAKHRLLQINNILPIIEKSHLTIIEKQNDVLVKYLLLVVILAILLAVLIYTLYRKNSAINQAKSSLELKTNELNSVNELLNSVNSQLKEQGRIKNTYILESLNSNSQYLSNMERVILNIVNKLRQNNSSSILRGIGVENIVKEERQHLLLSFDRAFFILFPDFIEQYNSLFLPEFRVDVSDRLNTEMRIVAIIRLGVKESDKVAQFLNISVNTVYSYKAKVKSRCIIKDEEFDDVIMRIIK